jgi:antitoxin (DNA-binding transcriptional repressor) of toxin-antitoxin stability system
MVEQVSKSEFKAKALQWFRRIEATGETVVITDHGRPRLEVRPFSDKPEGGETADEVFAPLRGMVMRYDDPFEPVGLDDWEALK